MKRPGSRRPARRIGLLGGLVGVPLAAAAGWIGYSALAVPHDLPLPNAVSGGRHTLDGRAGRLNYYVAGPPDAPPLLLVHSVNAAASAYEVGPLYEHYRTSRRVYALDLPGFGFSERSARAYTPRLMTDAVLAIAAEIRSRHGGAPADALALSLSSEFLARAAVEEPESFRSIALVSPTGFESRRPRTGPPGSTLAMPSLHGALTVPLWRRALFDLLNTRVSARFFLEKAWGSKQIDEGLLNYDYLTSHQPGAEHAPFYFVSGFLFSGDMDAVYAALDRPVWAVHGVRGDFVDYGRLDRVAGKPNWTIQIFQTGALPQFEVLADVTRSYDAFLARTTSM